MTLHGKLWASERLEKINKRMVYLEAHQYEAQDQVLPELQKDLRLRKEAIPLVAPNRPYSGFSAATRSQH
jgi:hypothetical protein